MRIQPKVRQENANPTLRIGVPLIHESTVDSESPAADPDIVPLPSVRADCTSGEIGFSRGRNAITDSLSRQPRSLIVAATTILMGPDDFGSSNVPRSIVTS